ncbi:MAG: hypothetical protein WBA87_06140 [Microbacterium sp.]
MTQHVRPTQRALADLGLVFPPLNIELHTLAHSLIQKAQRIPGEVASGGAERVRALKDRVWFKVKTGNLRGVVAEVQIPDGFGPRADADYSHSAWWLAAGGLRQDDTPTRDFYAVLSDECRRLAKGTGAGVYTAHLLPTAADYRRWQLENATVIAIALRRKVREAIARSAQTGALWIVTIGTFRVGALIHQNDGESYLAVTAEGFWDHRLLAVILDAVPGVSADDWETEPSDVSGIGPADGQVVYSTMLPVEALRAILDEVDDQFL